MTNYKKYKHEGPNSEDKALELFANMMIEKIESLKSDWKKPWFTEGAMKWPKNLSGREYNGLNAFMLFLHSEKEHYRLPVFMTFERVASLNYTKDKDGNKKPALSKDGEKLPFVSINKGEKSFPVFITTFTVVNKDTKEHIKYDQYKDLDDDEKKEYSVYPKLHVYNVFNVDQSNMKEARPELYAKLEDENIIKMPETHGEDYSFEPMDRMIKDNRWICPIRPHHQDEAYYSISKNEIVLPEKSQFIDGQSFYGTAFHEMTHSTGAKDILDRFKPGSAFGTKDYAREELVAELGSALISQRYGISKHLKEDSAAYLKSWLESLKESPEFIKTTLMDVKKASFIICQEVDNVKREIDQEKAEKRENNQAPLKELGVFDIPEWALNYLENGDGTNLNEEEIKSADDFIKKFPNGYLMNVDWENYNEINPYPAFGERNEKALTNKGESPFLATKTYSVQFLDPVVRDNTKGTETSKGKEYESVSISNDEHSESWQRSR